MFFNIVGQIIIGWLFADLLSGIFHWWQDRWPSASTWLIGMLLIAPSRLHHQKPNVFADNSFMRRNKVAFVGVSLFATLLLVTFGPSLFLLSATCGGLVSAQVHYLAHRPSRVNRLGKLLQISGIIQSPKHHALHHRSPHEMRYCVLTDFVNPLLDELKVWNKIEELCQRLGLKMSLGNR